MTKNGQFGKFFDNLKLAAKQIQILVLHDLILQFCMVKYLTDGCDSFLTKNIR